MKKLEICGIIDNTTCPCCGAKTSGKGEGDHIWGRLEYFNHENPEHRGNYGIVDSPWNKLPICGKCNPVYKKIKLTDGTIINIGCDNLTEKEKQLVQSEDKKKVDMILNWKAYVKERGAVLCFRPKTEAEEYIEEFLRRLDDFIDSEEKKMEDFLKKI